MTELQEEYIDRLEAENAALIAEVDRLRDASSDVLMDVGYYTLTHRLDSAAAYQERLDGLRGQIKDAIKIGAAIEAADGFIYNNSLAKGKRMVADLSKLMLRAYNAEAENCVRTVRPSSRAATVKRLDRAASAIAKLGDMMEMRISDNFHQLRVAEIDLMVDYLIKQQKEKEEEREERARLREERQAEKELAAERERLDKERSHYLNVLAALAPGDDRGDVEQRLADIDEAIANNDYRTANIRAGYVYVISNIGAFGPGMVKIGMTRRLDPMDRVRELGDASVPFGFDVHALFFADDAVGVEAELHRRFSHRRVNNVNLRREFFYTTPSDVKSELDQITGNLLEYAIEPEAEQYRLSRRALHSPRDVELG